LHLCADKACETSYLLFGKLVAWEASQTLRAELSEDELDGVAGGVSRLLSIDGVKGESTDDKHKETIDILSFSW
jgi:hypothetical protein